MNILTHDKIEKLFSNLENNQSEKFFESVSNDVTWEVMGTHPLAGVYHSKQDFLESTFLRLNKILKEGVVLKVTHIYIDGMTAIVEMESLSTAKNGKPFNNVYCWVVDFNDQQMITAVRAYVDSALVQKVINENEVE